METLILENDIKVIGFQVKTFPNGISEAFDSLVEKVPEGLARSYFGITTLMNGKTVYIAAVEEKNMNEAEKYNLDQYTIAKGEYFKVTLKNWRANLASIKDIFHEMMEHKNVDLTQPCIEWYRNENEMECMISRIPSP